MIFNNRNKENQSSHVLLTDVQHALCHAISEVETAFEHLSRSPENLEDAKDIHVYGVGRIRTILKVIETKLKSRDAV